MIIVEPQPVYERRCATLPRAPSTSEILDNWQEFIEADAPIIRCLQNGPVRETSVVNLVARSFRRPTKRQRTAVKWAILKRASALVRIGTLNRICRKFVCLPAHNCAATVAKCVALLRTKT